MGNLSDQYRSWLTGQLVAPSTLKERVKFFRRISGEIGDPATITAEQIATFLGQYTGWSRCSYYSALVSAMAFMVETGRREDNPMRDVRRPRQPKPRPRPLTAQETTLLLAAAVGHWQTWIMLALLAGLRSHEIAKIRGEDVTQSHLYVLGKGGKAALLPTHPSIWLLAQHYPREGWWFPTHSAAGHVTAHTVTLRTGELFRALGMTGSIHRLRATYATNLRRNGVDLKVIQELMRHDSLSATEHYLGVDEDERAAAIRTLAAVS